MAIRRASSKITTTISSGTVTFLFAECGGVGRRCYHLPMTVRKLSIALDNGTATAVQAAAKRRGVSVSSWLNEAAEHALRIEDGLRGVAEWEAEHGALTTAELAAADRFLTRKARRRAS